MSQLSYAVIGTGAVGGYFGGRLQQAGCEVHFLLRSDYEIVRNRGLIVDSVDGDFALPVVNAYNKAQDIPPVDVAIVALKTTSNKNLVDLLPAIKPGGAILPLQNGLDIEAAMFEQLSEQMSAVPTIFGGLCFICANKTEGGHIQHMDYGKILLGEYNKTQQPCPPSELLKKVAQDFDHANIETELTEDVHMARWQKLVWNVPFNGLSVVLNAMTDQMMKDANVRSLIEALMTEVVKVANAWARQISPGGDRALSNDIVYEMLTRTEKMPAYRTSMKVDYDKARPLELEAILQRPINVAKSLGIAVPAMEMLYQQLSFLDARNFSLDTRASGAV